MNKIILIDGDILAYELGFSVEKPMYVCDNRLYEMRGRAESWAKKSGKEVFKRINIGSFNQVLTNLRIKMMGMYDDLGTTRYKMYLTAGGLEQNYRFNIPKIMPYKGNRTLSSRPFWYKKIRQYLVEQCKAEVVRGQEADDAIGIEQYRIANNTGDFNSTYIASIDKDLKMLEGWHYNMTHKTIEHVDGEKALKNFYAQLLKGDATDNIPGLAKLLKQLGHVERSNKLSHSKPGYLKTFTEYCNNHSANECKDYVVNMYKKENMENYIEEIGQLLWIRRKENELWQLKES